MTEWTSRTPPSSGMLPRWADDGRLLVLDNRGFWIAVNINKSVPSWHQPGASNV
jgi:hypothetical protein